MSAPHPRPTPAPSLYAHALGLDAAPDSPPPPDGVGDRERFFAWHLPDDGTPPGERAAQALRRMAEEDPRSFAQRP
ncbi:hypothetical protein ACFXHD_11035 [Streptomyces hydrogenans]|uniref:hypothetical protein n=1 Tax=Streptomyces hydrogenans TaxID=1873719 RepID=UPI0035D90ABC